MIKPIYFVPTLLQETCEGCCPEELSEGILWSNTLQGNSDRRSCTFLHSSFNENTFVTRKCSNKGRWQPVDVSGCTFKESAELSVVVVVLSVRAEKNEIQANETAFKNQVCPLRYTLDIQYLQ